VLVVHDHTSIHDHAISCAEWSLSGRLRLDLAGLQHGCELDQFGLVLVRVVLAEEQNGARRQLRDDTGGSAASVAAISPS
jgi:hypothetical protein